MLQLVYMDTPEDINKPDALQNDMTTEPTEASLATAVDNNGALVRGKLDMILSDQAMADELGKLQQELATNSDFAEIQKLSTDNESLLAKSESATDTKIKRDLYQQHTELSRTIFSHPKYREFTTVENRIINLEKSKCRILQPDSDDAKTLLAAVSGADSNDEQGVPAPFMGYKQNTSESWQYVPDQAVKDFLDKRQFISTRDIDTDVNKVLISKGYDDEPISVNASLFVSVAGFDSWLGQGGKGFNKKEWSSEYGSGGHNSTSLDTIKHYASLTSELPSVDHVNIFVQPNGKMFADNGSGDSHRIAAAFLRGDKTIKADYVEFVKLDKDIL